MRARSACAAAPTCPTEVIYPGSAGNEVRHNAHMRSRQPSRVLCTASLSAPQPYAHERGAAARRMRVSAESAAHVAPRPVRILSRRSSTNGFPAAAAATAVTPYLISPDAGGCPERPPFCSMCAAQLAVLALMCAAATHIGGIEDMRGPSPISVLKLRTLRADLDGVGGGGIHRFDSRSEGLAREHCQFNATFVRLPVKAKLYVRALMRRAEGYASCALVGPSAFLLHSALGDEIDSHELVLRVEDAPTAGRERHVGSRTSAEVLGAGAVAARLVGACAAERAVAARAQRAVDADGDGTAGARANGGANASAAGCSAHPVFVTADGGSEGRALAQRCAAHSAAPVFPVPSVVRELARAELAAPGEGPSAAAVGVMLASLLCPNGARAARRAS